MSVEVAAAPVVRLRGLKRSFGDLTVLDGLDLDIAPGEFVALLGRSGSGKTTLLRALAGLDTEIEGELRTGGTPAVVFQDPRLLPWRSVLDNVAVGLRDDDRDGDVLRGGAGRAADRRRGRRRGGHGAGRRRPGVAERALAARRDADRDGVAGVRGDRTLEDVYFSLTTGTGR